MGRALSYEVGDVGLNLHRVLNAGFPLPGKRAVTRRVLVFFQWCAPQSLLLTTRLNESDPGCCLQLSNGAV